MLVALAGSAAAVATWAGAFDHDDAEVAAVAERYAGALTSGDSRRLAAVTCQDPTKSQAIAFESRTGSGSLRWLVHRPPVIEDDVANGTLRATDGSRHRDYPFTLHHREDGWCAHYNWNRLDARAKP